MKIFIINFILLTSSLCAADEKLFTQAQSALEEGLPQVALEKWNAYLDSGVSGEKSRIARLGIASAHTYLNQTEKARAILTTLVDNDETQFYFIQTYLKDQNWVEVVARLAIVPPQESTFHVPLIFARAEARRALEQYSLAFDDYQAIDDDSILGKEAKLRKMEIALLTDKNSSALHKEKASKMEILLGAEKALRAKRYSEAEHDFRSLLGDSTQLTSRAFAAVRLGLARCLVAQKRPDEAEDVLGNFIEEQPEHPDLNEVFTELNHVYEAEENPSLNQLRIWSRDAVNTSRQSLAIYYQFLFQLRQKGSEADQSTLADWLKKFPNHPMRADVLLRNGDQLGIEGKWNAAIHNYNEALAISNRSITSVRSHLALASAFFVMGKYDKASEQYTLAAPLAFSASRILLYNAALCSLREGAKDRFLADYETYSAQFPDSPLRADLLVEDGFLKARSREFDMARDTLYRVILEFPKHRRRADAYLALAEIAMSLTVADSVSAQTNLAAAASSSPSRETAEQIAYLQLFQQPGQPSLDLEKQIELGDKFIRDHPGSKLEAEVRFKLGEAFFAKKNFAAAGTQFEIIADQFTDSPLLEQACFLAGQSALKTMNPEAINRAISLFQKVVDMKGALQSYARFEQATVKKNAGSLDEALILYNDLLTQNPELDLLAATLAGKGETLYLQGGTDQKKLAEAGVIFKVLSETPNISRYWRNLALYKMGKTLGQMGQKNAMLTAFYDVLTLSADSQDTPEYFWYYRAGFEAAEILESDQEWKAAIAIYKKLAETKGPRAAEAGDRIQRLRLKYFVWEK